MPSNSEQVKKSWITRHANMPPKTTHVCKACGVEKKYPEDFFLQKWDGNGKKYASRCNDCHRKRSRTYYRELKSEIFAFFGNKCNWLGCEWTDPRALQIDHVNGGGRKEVKEIGTHRMYRKVRDNPTGYQLLCANHNQIKKHESPNEYSGKVGRGKTKRAVA